MSNILSVGILSAPRGVMYIGQSLASYFLEWQITPHVFAEPGTPSFVGENKVIRYDNPVKLGCVKNWLGTAQYLLAKTDTPYLMICEDDILWTEGAADKIVNMLKFLRGDLDLMVRPPEPNSVGLISAYCAKINAPQYSGWCHPKIRSTGLCGALCMIFPRRSLQDILAESDYFLEQTVNSSGESVLLDYAIGRTVQKLNKRMYVHNPTLVQHLGDVSTFPQNNKPHSVFHKARIQQL